MGVSRNVLNWYARLSPARGAAVPPYSHVVQIGDPILRRKSQPVPLDLIKSEKIQEVIRRMRSVMDSYGAVGLAAPQIGVNLRIIAIQVKQRHLDEARPALVKSRGMTEVPFTAFLNPRMRILDFNKVILPEGCESIRGFVADVCRYKMVEICGYNPEGDMDSVVYKDWAARIVQHEMDHLEGRLYTDFMDRNTLSCTCWEEVNLAQGKIVLPFCPDC